MNLQPATLHIWSEIDWESGQTAWRWRLELRGDCHVTTVRSHRHAAGAKRAARERARRFGLCIVLQATRETPVDKRRALA